MEELRNNNELLEIKAHTLQNDFNVVNEERGRLLQENLKLSNKISEMMDEQASFQNNLDIVFKEKFMLQNELESLNKIDSDKKDSGLALQYEIEKLNRELVNRDSEKQKMQDELDTITDSYYYSLDELSNLNKLLNNPDENLILSNQNTPSKNKKRSGSFLEKSKSNRSKFSDD